MYFIPSDKEKIAEKILTNGGNVNLIDEDGRTALHLAASSGNFRIHCLDNSNQLKKDFGLKFV